MSRDVSHLKTIFWKTLNQQCVNLKILNQNQTFENCLNLKFIDAYKYIHIRPDSRTNVKMFAYYRYMK